LNNNKLVGSLPSELGLMTTLNALCVARLLACLAGTHRVAHRLALHPPAPPEARASAAARALALASSPGLARARSR
jgi:hypothetical protein